MSRSTAARFVVTHCHSRYSRNRASPMDAYIRAAVERVTGEPAGDFDWSESLTSPETLARLVREPDPRQPIDLLFVTDHVNETFTGFDPELEALCLDEPRIGLGAELQTVVEAPEGSGRWLAGPEILLYGGPDAVAGRAGIEGAELVDLLASARPVGGGRPELHRVVSRARDRGWVHALAHPLDGHGLDLAATLDALADVTFVEVVNGGFAGPSARRLEHYVRLRNTLASGRRVLESPAPVVRRMVDALARRPAEARWAVPWGGSDAHLGHYGRVRMQWRPQRPSGSGLRDLLADLADTPPRQLLADSALEIVGRGTRLSSSLTEVLRLVAANARRNGATFRGPRRLARLAWFGSTLAVAEVLRHRRSQARLGRALDDLLEATEAALAAAPDASSWSASWSGASAD